MDSLQVDRVRINSLPKVFIIAEIGQNHQGSLEIAKNMISTAKQCGCDCVKFQKSNLSEKFTKSALNRLYINSNSFGTTYGDHKCFLEFTLEDFKQLKAHADSEGILFSASAMDEISLTELFSLKLPFVKIGSGDANNFPLLRKAAKSTVPLIISTGMQEMSTIEKIVNIMDENSKDNFALMHCVSSYPTKPENVNLQMIQLLKKKFRKIIGYSGHEEGILLTQAAVLFGAKIIERHFTLDKTLKGTDHSCSLDPFEFKKLVERIRYFENIPLPLTNNEIMEYILFSEGKTIDNENNISLAMKDVSQKTILNCEMQCRNKLGKSIVYANNFYLGYQLLNRDLEIKVSEPFGTTAERYDEFVGKILKKNVKKDENLREEDFI